VGTPPLPSRNKATLAASQLGHNHSEWCKYAQKICNTYKRLIGHYCTQESSAGPGLVRPAPLVTPVSTGLPTAPRSARPSVGRGCHNHAQSDKGPLQGSIAGPKGTGQSQPLCRGAWPGSKDHQLQPFHPWQIPEIWQCYPRGHHQSEKKVLQSFAQRFLAHRCSRACSMSDRA